MLFEQVVDFDLFDQLFSRMIGGFFGNDFGQMCIWFDVKGYVVQFVYCDDNIGIWDFGDVVELVIEMQDIVEGVWVEQQQCDDGKLDDEVEDRGDNEVVGKVCLSCDVFDGVFVVWYFEYDYFVCKDCIEWCFV